jgi:glucose uptake protein GlcU
MQLKEIKLKESGDTKDTFTYKLCVVELTSINSIEIIIICYNSGIFWSGGQVYQNGTMPHCVPFF